MKKIDLRTTDTIYATVTAGGNMIARMTLSGYATMQELMKSIFGRLGKVVGLVTVELRNGTMGWMERRSVKLTAAVQPSTPVQLTLF